MKSKILVGTALLFSISAMQSCSDNPSESNNNKKGMDSSMNHMEKSDSMHAGKMKMTGDFDYDFATTMIAHHQTAIDMAKVEMSKGSNAAMKSMAEGIVKAQEAEIGQFKAILKEYKIPEMKKEGGEMHNELGEIMEKMETKMKGMALSGNADKDFAMMMVPHHESAVAMAEDELSHGKNLALKQMAQKIIEDQSNEIKEFQQWLGKNK